MTTTHFPAVGHVYEAHFGDWAFHLHFASETIMTLTSTQGLFTGTTETVQISVTPIRSGVFLICWQEADKTTVVHIEDFKNGVVHTRVTEPKLGVHTRLRYLEKGAVTV
ncbi:MAG: MoaF-related domain-containing protein [Ktedonobacteraceae bacterium]